LHSMKLGRGSDYPTMFMLDASEEWKEHHWCITAINSDSTKVGTEGEGAHVGRLTNPDNVEPKPLVCTNYRTWQQP
jgi:hypothetical protein